MPAIQSANAGSASDRLLATAFLAASISPGNAFHRAASFSSLTTVMYAFTPSFTLPSKPLCFVFRKNAASE